MFVDRQKESISELVSKRFVLCDASEEERVIHHPRENEKGTKRHRNGHSQGEL